MNICNNCGSDQYKVVFKAGKSQINQIVKCNNCGLMFAYPIKIDLDSEYWEGEEHKETDNLSAFDVKSENFQLMLDKKERIQIQDYMSSLKVVESFIGKKGKALEIGSSRGFFLDRLKNSDWEVEGIEPSLSRREEAKKLFGFDLIAERLEDTNLEENSFDAIFLFHVIEHVLNPKEFVSIINKYLKPGGVFVMETPTYDTLTYKILRHRERSLRCDGHIYFFTKKSLRKVVEQNNFKVIKHERVGRTLTVERLFWNIAVITKNRTLESFLIKVSNILKLNKAKIYLNFGDMQRIFCTKE